MTQPVRILRSSTLGNRPPAGTPDGSPYVNFAENQFGVNNAGVNVDLLGVPNFSPNVVYAPATAVAYQGQIWISNATIPAGAWNPAGWSPVMPKSYVDNSLDYSVGFQNSFRNGNMDIWARGAPALPVATTMGPDGWRIGVAGAAATLNVGGVPSGTNWSANATNLTMPVSANSLNVVGAAGTTTVTIDQILESYVYCPSLAGRRCVAQALYYGPAGMTPQFTLYLPTVRDNWAASTNPIPLTNLLPLSAANTWIRVGFGFDMPASAATLGALIRWSFPAVGAGSIAFTEADVRAVAGAPLGVFQSPLPQIECRPTPIQLLENQRYYEASSGAYVIASSPYGAAGATWYHNVWFKMRKRAIPTFTPVSVSYSNGSGLAINSGGTDFMSMQYAVTAAGGAYALYNWTAACEIA